MLYFLNPAFGLPVEVQDYRTYSFSNWSQMFRERGVDFGHVTVYAIRMSTPSGYFGGPPVTSNGREDRVLESDLEAARCVGGPILEPATYTCSFLPITYSPSAQGVRGRKSSSSTGQREQSQRQSFYHLRQYYRYPNFNSLPAIAIITGLLFVLIMPYREYSYRMTQGIVDQASPTAQFPSSLAGPAVVYDQTLSNFGQHSRVGGEFRRRILDTFQGMLWVSRPPGHSQLREAYLRTVRGGMRGNSDRAVSDVTMLHEEVYHNFTHFTETYAAMEETFKIYVYKDGYKPLVHGAKMEGVFATEGLFLERMEQPGNRFIVSDPSQAGMFLLPYSVRQMVDYLQDPYSRSMRPLRTYIANYVETLASKYPYWNRTHGADHFFVSCHDWAPLSTKYHDELHRNAMKVVCNADLKANFNTEKDVSIPQTMKGGNQSDHDIGNLGPDERDFLAFYAGQMHGRVRSVLINHWRGKDPSMKVYEVLPPEIARDISYSQHMKRSKYCLCPRGFEVNSPRIVEAILSGCVPVIIADNFVLPYSDVLDWMKFSVTVLEQDIPHLKRILTSIPDGIYRSMQRRLRYIRRHFVWLDDPEDAAQYDSFHMALYSIWRQSRACAAREKPNPTRN